MTTDGSLENDQAGSIAGGVSSAVALRVFCAVILGGLAGINDTRDGSAEATGLVSDSKSRFWKPVPESEEEFKRIEIW